MRPRSPVWALAGLLALPGCTLLQPPTRAAPAPAAPVYEVYANEGELPVRGAAADDPGPQIYAEVLAVPRLTAFLQSQGTPETVEVIEDEEGLRIHLSYTRRGRRILVERVDGRLSAHAPTRLDGSPLGGGRRAPPRAEGRPGPPESPEAGAAAEPEAEAAAAELPTPSGPLATELQLLECPIDPEREDCVSLCTPPASYEWCP